MKNLMTSLFATVLACLLLSGCLAKTQRVGVDTDEPFDSTETSSKDLQTVADKMVSSLLQLPQVTSATAPPRVAFVTVTNNTNEILNKDLFLRKMRTMLIRNAAGKMVFLDRASLDAIKDERGSKRSGEFSSGKNKMIAGADFFLTGTLDSIDKFGGGKRSTYTRYSFRLTDAESGAIHWEDDYEVKKVGSAGLYDR